jgi:hypothetical protein
LDENRELPAAPPPLDEASLRRDDFAGGEPSTMADGQTWRLAKPQVRFSYDDGPRGFRVTLSMPGQPIDEYQRLVDEMEQATTMDDRIRAELAVGAALLRRNYRLGSADLGRLLAFAYDEEADPEGFALRQRVLDVAMGVAPKAPAATSG